MKGIGDPLVVAGCTFDSGGGGAIIGSTQFRKFVFKSHQSTLPLELRVTSIGP